MWNHSLPYFIYMLDLLALCYFGLIAAYTYGWYKSGRKRELRKESDITVSVLIAARNEADHIETLLKSLRNQQYPVHLLDMYIVDDHSDDQTANRVKAFKQQHPYLPLQLLNNEGTGKKAALNTALHQARGELVLVTDADCELPANWIKQMAATYKNDSCKMLLGPVVLKSGKHFFDQWQALEFVSLMGSTAGAAGLGLPVMGNAANMGFDRQTALGLHAFSPSAHASGDDMFLMMAIRKEFGKNAIRFVHAQEAIVETAAQPGLRRFFQQRMRWVSKSRAYTSMLVILPAMIVFLFNMALVLSVLAGIGKPLFFLVFVLFVLLKFLIDYPLLYLASGFLRLRHLLPWSLFLQFVYPFYVTLTALAGLLLPYRWKGRLHRE